MGVSELLDDDAPEGELLRVVGEGAAHEGCEVVGAGAGEDGALEEGRPVHLEPGALATPATSQPSSQIVRFASSTNPAAVDWMFCR